MNGNEEFLPQFLRVSSGWSKGRGSGTVTSKPAPWKKEAKLPESYHGPNRQNCLLINDDKLTEPLYRRSSYCVRLKFFQLKFDEIKWYTLSTYECCLSGPGWIFLFFCRFQAENILTALGGFVHFFCAIFTVQIMSGAPNEDIVQNHLT